MTQWIADGHSVYTQHQRSLRDELRAVRPNASSSSISGWWLITSHRLERDDVDTSEDVAHTNLNIELTFYMVGYRSTHNRLTTTLL